jgi:hypothetical protein
MEKQQYGIRYFRDSQLSFEMRPKTKTTKITKHFGHNSVIVFYRRVYILLFVLGVGKPLIKLASISADV